MKWDLVVIGGGAAGFFGAIQVATKHPALKVLILEKTSKLLTKVRISGGGRCNVTHDCKNPYELARHYPRGAKPLKGMFREFHNDHISDWFEARGVKLKTERDGRRFPVSDNSKTIIDCFMEEARRLGIRVNTSTPVAAVNQQSGGFRVSIADGSAVEAKRILITTGGNSHREAYDWISGLGHTIISPVPSLFTFNDRDKHYCDLMGISVSDAEVKIVGTRLAKRGPVLITHWGLSGPAVITLSAWSAEYLHRENYQFEVLVNWTGGVGEQEVKKSLLEYKEKYGKQVVSTNPMFVIPQRLWQRLCRMAEIDEAKRWNEMSQRSLNKLTEFVIRCPFQIQGKTTFKEEFVTCGGVDLNEIDLNTMESKRISGVYFAGEVLHIDGETGGFNFQAAWTTAYLAAQGITTSLADG
jgi:hypothetical protein